MKEYLEWERQATVLPILMCMEAWMEPTRKYFGQAFPATYIKYDGDIVSWYTKMDGLHELGQRIINQHLEKKGLDQFLKDVEKTAKEFDQFFQEIEKTSPSDISDRQLFENFKKIHELYVNWFVLGAVCEPVGIRGEHLINELVKHSEKPERSLSILTTTTRKSFSRRELEDLLKIVIQYKEGKDIGKLLVSHSKKWFWVHNNYLKTEVLDKDHFKTDLETVLNKYQNPEKYLNELELSITQTTDEKKRLVEKLNLSEKERRLIEILDVHAWYQDYRKEYTMMVLHYLDIILKEIAKRIGLTLREIKWLLADEIIALLNNEIPKDLIVHREKYAFFVWENNKFESFSGTQARKKEAEVLKLIKTAKEIIEIPGNVANKGVVRGIARVTMSSHEAKNLQKGEIIVTSMTSPDFISAVKKAAAIVTNEGGILCHAAIVSREFGIPCIVGTGIATKSIKDGDLIEVDANHGFVRILKR